MRCRFLLLGCTLVTASLLPQAHADDAAGAPDPRAIHRERLIGDAKRVIQRSGLGSVASAREVVVGLRQTVAKQRSLEGASDAELDAGLTWLLGPESDDAGDPAWGALLQAVWLDRWLDGEETAGRYALRAPAADEKAKDVFCTEAEWGSLQEDERRRLLEGYVLDAQRLGDRGRTPSRQLDLETMMTLGVGDGAHPVTLDPVAGLRAPPALENGRALVSAEELEDEISERWVRARTAQADVHVAAWSQEKPSDLVTEGGVNRRVERATALDAELARWQQLATTTRDALDAMVEQDMEVHRRVFALETSLQSAKEAPGADDPASEAGRTRARLNLQEIRAKLEQRMLCLAVVRAARRLELLGRVEDVLHRERVVAGTVQDRYEQRLRRVRREAQLSHLARDRGWFEANRSSARANAPDGDDPAQGAWLAYVALLDDLVAMNEILVDLVGLVQTLEVYVEPAEGEPPAPGTGGASDPSEAEGADAEPVDPEPVPASSASQAEPGATFGLLLEPEKYVHRPGFVSQTKEALADPSFDASLVARTYDAASDYVAARRRALDASRRAETLEAEYERRSEGMEARLDDVGRRLPSNMGWDIWQIRDRCQPYGELLSRTMKDIRQERARAQRQIEDLDALCQDLTGLGPRSLGIRASHDLDPRALREAGNAARSGLGRAWRWLTSQSEPNLGSFLAARWSYVVACLLVAGLLIAVVRVGRRRIDGVLDRLGRGVPVLREEGVTVAGEAAAAREAQKHKQEAAAEAEAAALADASKKAVEQPPTSDVPAPAEGAPDDADEGGPR